MFVDKKGIQKARKRSPIKCNQSDKGSSRMAGPLRIIDVIVEEIPDHRAIILFS